MSDDEIQPSLAGLKGIFFGSQPRIGFGENRRTMLGYSQASLRDSGKKAVQRSPAGLLSLFQTLSQQT